MHRIKLAEAVVHLDGRPITFEGRPYLNQIYGSAADRLVLRCARQTEKSTTLGIFVLLKAMGNPSSRILVVMPRQEQLRVFREIRLLPIMRDSPVIWRTLGGRGATITAAHWLLANGALIYFRSAWTSADSSRGISATDLFIDEAQDIAEGSIPVVEQTLSHAVCKRVIMSGTPKLTDNPLEMHYCLSTQKQWMVTCDACGHPNIPDEAVLGKDGTVCAKCHKPISMGRGEWRSANPLSTYGEGFWINNLMVPWKNYGEVLAEKDSYDPAKFRNEVLGLPAVIGDYAVTREEVEACCTDRLNAPPERSLPLAVKPGSLTLGVDWGGGARTRSAFVLIGYGQDQKFHVLSIQTLPIHADHRQALDLAERILRQHPDCNFVADGNGNGAVLNRELLARPGLRTRAFWSIFYADMTSPPQEMSLGHMRWTVGRTAAIANVVTCIKRKTLTLPSKETCGDMLADLYKETAVYDPLRRTLRYEPQPGCNDDVLHALTYALAI